MREFEFRADDPGQDAVRSWFVRLGSEKRLLLMTSLRGDGYSMGSYCALAPTTYRATALHDPGWDLHHGTHGPGFSQRPDESGGVLTTYHAVGSEPLEPLVIERNFHGVRDPHDELSEQFRLYHDLYRDEDGKRLLKSTRPATR